MLRIITGYKEGMEEYLRAARTAPDPDLSALHMKHVLHEGGVWDGCIAGSLAEQFNFWPAFLAKPIQDLDRLEAAINAMHAADLEDRLREVLEPAFSLLSSEHTTVAILAADPEDEIVGTLLGGVGGFTSGANRIVLQVNPSNPDWLDFFDYVPVHEYHHSCWLCGESGVRLPFLNVMTQTIFEGSADSFAHQLVPEFKAPWTSSLSAAQTRTAWQNLQPVLYEHDPKVLQQWLFGSAEQPWPSYCLGFQIVQAFLKRHAETSVREWTEMEPKDLFEQSGFDPS
jgi:uncharacterized protein YjaZ